MWTAWTLIVVHESYPNYESRAPPGASARQGKETGRFVGTCKVLRDDRTVGCHLEREVGMATVVVCKVTQSERR